MFIYSRDLSIFEVTLSFLTEVEVEIIFIENNGHTPWPTGCRLEYINGRKLAGPNSVEVPALQAGETTQGVYQDTIYVPVISA